MCCVTVLHVLVVYWHHALWSFLQRRSLNVGGHSFTVSLSSRDRFEKTHLLPFRKTRRCQRYNNERGRRSLVRTTKKRSSTPRDSKRPRGADSCSWSRSHICSGPCSLTSGGRKFLQPINTKSRNAESVQSEESESPWERLRAGC